MSYYDNQQWSAAGNQTTWDHQTPPARSGASSVVQHEDSPAFSSQIEEVDRAIENLFKSGKVFPNMPTRRESIGVPGQGRGFSEFGAAAGPPRHHSVSEFGEGRSYSASNLQTFYATQRHQPSRASEAEQVMQAKRRMAAQRERELRNYHQEQQYNRTEISTFGGKPDRTISPGSGMGEEERRELIARQRSALYGEGASPFPDNGSFEDGAASRPGQGNVGRGPSPLAGQQTSGEAGVPQSRSRANSTSSPSSNQANSFALFDNAQQSSRTSTSSPGGSPPRQGKPALGSVAPIGTRPAGQVANPALNKRSTTPLPSPLSYGFGAGNNDESKVDRSTSAASNPSTTPEVGLGWGNKSGVWGKNTLGVQASVWG